MVPTEILQFCKDITEEELLRLPFQKQKFQEVTNAWLVNQARCYRIAKSKLPQWWSLGNRVFPDTEALEQCTSEWVARWKIELVPTHLDSLIDLSAGLGVDAHWLGKMLKNRILVEPNPDRARLLKANQMANDSRVEVFETDSISFLHKHLHLITADTLVYLDPDRRSENGKRLSSWKDCSPDVKAVIDLIEPSKCYLFAKLSPLDNPDELIGELPGLYAIYTISLHNEVKEVLACWKLGSKQDRPERFAVEISKSGFYRKIEVQDFRIDKAHFHTPEPGFYLYDPWASIRKNYQTGFLSDQFHVDPVSFHSQLFTSVDFIPDFPGRIFKIIDKPLNLKFFGQEYRNKPTQVVSRGMVEQAESVKKKFSFKDGGETYLFCIQGAENQTHYLHCERINVVINPLTWAPLPL